MLFNKAKRHAQLTVFANVTCTVPDRSNLTGNELLERLGNAKRKAKGMLRERKGNAKRMLEIKSSVLRGTRSWEHSRGSQNSVELSKRCVKMAHDNPYALRKNYRKKKRKQTLKSDPS